MKKDVGLLLISIFMLFVTSILFVSSQSPTPVPTSTPSYSPQTSPSKPNIFLRVLTKAKCLFSTKC